MSSVTSPCARNKNLVLTVRLPWAWLIVHGLTDVENRAWLPGAWFGDPERTPVRIYIHASKELQYTDVGWILDRVGAAQQDLVRAYLDDLYRARWQSSARAWAVDPPAWTGCGRIVGEVSVVGFDHAYPSPWAEVGYRHWVLADAVAYEEGIPCRGGLGLWRLPAGIVLPARPREAS